MRPPVALLLAALASIATAQTDRIRHLEDNSFLLEEAYNQEVGVVHNISTFSRDRDTKNWVATFTQEWPVVDETHQVAFTVTGSGLRGPGNARVEGLGDLALHYRYQVISDEARTAFAPRVTLLVPTGASRQGLGAGGVGTQVNLPFSMRLGDYLVSHTNLGGGLTPDGRGTDGSVASYRSIFAGQSLIALIHYRFNVLAELLWTGTETTSHGRTTRADTLYVSPGLRFGIDVPGGLQIVPGLAVPIGIGPSAGSVSIFGYLSFEFPFSRTAAGPGKG
jgi:hypothetical protein